jgi:pimeloyl-ACP methyl ester carboxylesterase
VSVALHDFGAPGGLPVLLAHATGFHGMVWAPLAQHLDGYHAVAPDFRGHGDTPTPTGRDLDWQGVADDVLAVVDAWDAAPLVAVGHSMGGAALLLAEQRRPGTFRALYCYEPVVFPEGSFPSGPGDGDNPLAASALRRRDTFASFDEAYDNFAGKPPLSALSPEALHEYVDHGFARQPDGSLHLKCRPEVEAAVYRMAPQHHAFRHLPEVTCPVTIARGEMTDSGPGAFADAVAGELPHGRVEVFDGLGHFGPLEDPARVAARIVAAFEPVG